MPQKEKLKVYKQIKANIKREKNIKDYEKSPTRAYLENKEKFVEMIMSPEVMEKIEKIVK